MSELPLERYVAAGGVVLDDDGNGGHRVLVLVDTAKGEVRLPKGHVDPGETVDEAARREVAEETGFVDLEAAADLGSQTVAFALPESSRPRRVEREERYLLFRLASTTTAERPAADAARFTPTWMDLREAARLLTHAPEREWLRRAGEVVRGAGAR